MPLCASQEHVIAFWERAERDQKASHCEMRSDTFPFFVLAEKSD